MKMREFVQVDWYAYAGAGANPRIGDTVVTVTDPSPDGNWEGDLILDDDGIGISISRFVKGPVPADGDGPGEQEDLHGNVNLPRPWGELAAAGFPDTLTIDEFKRFFPDAVTI